MLSALAIASPQFWSRIDAPSNLQPIFLLSFALMALFRGKICLPSRPAPRLVLIGFCALLIGGVFSLPFAIEFELFKQEFYRRIILFIFLISAYTAATNSDKLLRAITYIAIIAIVIYTATMALYYSGWGVFSDNGTFDSYPFGILIPIAIYNNPLIFSETQVFGYFLIGIAMLRVTKASKNVWPIAIIGLIQFGKGPIIGYLASLLPSLSRILLLLIAPLIIVFAAIGYTGAPRFDGDFGSLSERLFHASFVFHSLLEHPLFGALGYGFRQYGTYTQFISGDFNQDTQPLSIMQWFFEEGVLIALFGLLALFVGSIVLSGRRWLPVGIYLFIGHLALPNPADPAVLLLFALFAAQINISSARSV